MSASPSPRHGRTALAHSPDGCVAAQPSCAKSGSRSPSRRKEEPRTRIVHITHPHQKMQVHNRPHRPHSPRPGQMAQTSLTSRPTDCGRLRATRTVATLQPSARTTWEPTPGAQRTVRTQNHHPNLRPEEPKRLAGGGGYDCSSCAQVGTCRWHSRAYRRRRPGASRRLHNPRRKCSSSSRCTKPTS